MDNFKKFYNQLNNQQKEAADSVDGTILVLAGPGTGKTELLSVRAANIIIQKKASAENILILAYTNAATKAMKERLTKILGPIGYEVLVDTFHGFANSIIRDSEEMAEYISKRLQITDIEQIKAFEYILNHYQGLDDIRPFGSPYFYVDEIKGRIRDLKNEGVTPQEFKEFIDGLKPDGVYIEAKHIGRLKGLATCFVAYEELKKGQNKEIFDERGRYDYEDMIIIANQALKGEKDLRDHYHAQYKYIMIDEYQDTNGAQLNLLFSLAKTEPNLCCVGDDDQSIYRFQGASVGNFTVLKERFPRIKMISLKENFRSTKEIIDVSTNIIKSIPPQERTQDKQLIPKKDYSNKHIQAIEFSTEDEELAFIINKIKQLKKIIENSKDLNRDEREKPYNAIAILVRKRDYILKIIDYFLRAGIPYSTDGKEDISGETRVMQMLDALELAHTDPKDLEVSGLLLYKVLSSDYLRIIQPDILKFINYANLQRQSNQQSLLNKFLESFYVTDTQTPPAKNDTENLLIVKSIKFTDPYKLHKAAWIINRLRQNAEAKPIHYILLQFIKDAHLYKYILDAYDKNRIVKIRQLRALTSFINMVKNSDITKPGARLADFLDELNTRRTHNIPLVGEVVTQTQDGVRIFTAHGCKGQEFHSVIIPFCLHEKSWPLRPQGEKIPLPPNIYKTKQRQQEKEKLKKLFMYDETRLFYVASSRAKSNLIFTASPTEDAVMSPFFGTMGIEVKRHEIDDEERILLESLLKTEKEDAFLDSADILRDVVRNLKLTPTKLNNYIFCKRKFLYNDVLLLPGKKKPSLIFGNCAHKAAESLYRVFKESGKFPDFDFFKDEFMNALVFQGADEPTRRGCISKFDNLLKKWYQRISKNPIMPLGLENRMIITVGDNIDFVGKYDKLELEDEKNRLVRVIDYKSGVPDKHIKALRNYPDITSEDCDGYLRQLVAYKLLFDRDKRQNRGFCVSHGVLVFFEPTKEDVKKYDLKPGEFREEKVPITQDMVGQLEGLIKDCWQNIQKLDFAKLPERDKEKCPPCDFDDICWGGV